MHISIVFILLCCILITQTETNTCSLFSQMLVCLGKGNSTSLVVMNKNGYATKFESAG